MKDLIQTAKIILLAAIVFLGANYVLAWVGPTATPPSGNVEAPVNTGATTQLKDGALGISGLLSAFGNLYVEGSAGIGDSTPDGTLKLDVEGKMGATHYCDENGANCVAATDIGGGSMSGVSICADVTAGSNTMCYTIVPPQLNYQRLNINGCFGDQLCITSGVYQDTCDGSYGAEFSCTAAIQGCVDVWPDFTADRPGSDGQHYAIDTVLCFGDKKVLVK